MLFLLQSTKQNTSLLFRKPSCINIKQVQLQHFPAFASNCIGFANSMGLFFGHGVGVQSNVICFATQQTNYLAQ